MGHNSDLLYWKLWWAVVMLILAIERNLPLVLVLWSTLTTGETESLFGANTTICSVYASPRGPGIRLVLISDYY